MSKTNFNLQLSCEVNKMMLRMESGIQNAKIKRNKSIDCCMLCMMDWKDAPTQSWFCLHLSTKTIAKLKIGRFFKPNSYFHRSTCSSVYPHLISPNQKKKKQSFIIYCLILKYTPLSKFSIKTNPFLQLYAQCAV